MGDEVADLGEAHAGGVIGANDEGVGVLARADAEDRQAAALVGDDRLQLVGVRLAIAGRLRLVVVAEARPDVFGDQVDLARPRAPAGEPGGRRC